MDAGQSLVHIINSVLGISLFWLRFVFISSQYYKSYIEKLLTKLITNVDIIKWFFFVLLQVLFLMYHYFSAREIYNVGRVCVAAYVWMTGFGNFSYYYVQKDFSISRFVQVCSSIDSSISSSYFVYR